MNIQQFSFEFQYAIIEMNAQRRSIKIQLPEKKITAVFIRYFYILIRKYMFLRMWFLTFFSVITRYLRLSFMCFNVLFIDYNKKKNQLLN